MVGRLKEASSTIFKQQKPWSELLDRSAMSKPESFGEATSRIRKNASYFRVNYLLTILATTIVSFVMHPTSLLILGVLLAAWLYVLFIRQQPILIAGRELSHKEKLIGMGAISFVTIFFLTSVGTVFFSALTFSCAAIALHGAFREPDNLFVDDAESSQPFLGFLTGSSAAPTGVAIV